MVQDFFSSWQRAGHRLHLVIGLDDLPDADVAIMHVDLSLLPQDYLRAARSRYPVLINGAATDIRKRVVSRQLLERDDPWAGPVMVKDDLNCGGYSEYFHGQTAREKSRKSVEAVESVLTEYKIFPSLAAVPAHVWGHDRFIVERFTPEQDERGYWMRTWVFFGDRERCNRNLGSGPIIKSRDIVEQQAVEVPEEMRAERRRLGFDFGKFDFVVHNGQPILLDANRTPGRRTTASSVTANEILAAGLDAFL